MSDFDHTPEEYKDFRIRLEQLCTQYGILIKRETKRRDKPTDPHTFHEIELSIKVAELPLHRQRGQGFTGEIREFRRAK